MSLQDKRDNDQQTIPVIIRVPTSYRQRASEILKLSIPNASIRAVNNLKSTIYTCLLARRTTATIDFVSPYTRVDIVALLIRASGGLLEPLDALINQAVGNINHLHIQAQEAGDSAGSNPLQLITQQQHRIRELITNAYLVALLDCLIVQGIYLIIPPGLGALDQLGNHIDNAEPAAELAARLEQIHAYGQWIRVGVCFELLSLPSLSLLLAHKRRSTVLQIGLLTNLSEIAAMYAMIQRPGDHMPTRLSDYGMIFMLSMLADFILLTLAVLRDKDLSIYLRPRLQHIDRRPLKRLLALGLPILAQMLASAMAMYAFALCVIDLISPTALKTHYAPRRIMYQLADFLPIIGKSTSILMTQIPQQRVKFAITCVTTTNLVFLGVAILFATLAHQLADQFIGENSYDSTIIGSVFMWSLLGTGCYIHSMTLSHFLMSMQKTLWPALVKTLMLMLAVPMLSFVLSRYNGLVGAEQGVSLATGLMLLGMGLLFLRANHQANTLPLLPHDQIRSDSAPTSVQRDRYQQWQASRATTPLITSSSMFCLCPIASTIVPFHTERDDIAFTPN